MAETHFPVDVRNAGQVFACLGLMEAAERLVGPTSGGFDLDKGRFCLRSEGNGDPLSTVLEFLARARLEQLAPPGFDELPDVTYVETFPAPQGKSRELPVRLVDGARSFVLSHWTDGTRRHRFKLYGGNRSAYKIASDMLYGSKGKHGIVHLWETRQEELLDNPFGVLSILGGTYNLDARGAWTALDAGYSPDAQGDALASSPLTELLAAWGLENARPNLDNRIVRYTVWGLILPLVLARVVMGGACALPIPARTFQFEISMKSLGDKIVNFAEEVAV